MFGCSSANSGCSIIPPLSPNASGEANAKLLSEAIEESTDTGRPVEICSSNEHIPIYGDVFMSGRHTALYSKGIAILDFEDGGLNIDGAASSENLQFNIGLRNITVNRSGTVGPAIKLSSVIGGNAIRTEWSNVRVESSTGDGLAVRGSYLHTIHGLYISGCDGNGLDFRKNDAPNANGAGTNSFSVFGGEIQNCAWGVAANDTRNVSLMGVAIEGNDDGGVVLESDNRNFLASGCYFEHNATERPQIAGSERYCDFWLAEDGLPNYACSVRDCGFADGPMNHAHAMYIEDGNYSFVVDNSYFFAYSLAPIRLASGNANTTTGEARGGVRRDQAGNVLSNLVSAPLNTSFTQ